MMVRSTTIPQVLPCLTFMARWKQVLIHYSVNLYNCWYKFIIDLKNSVRQIFDKLCQSFGGDVLQTLFSTAEGLASCSPENMTFWLWRFISDQSLAVAASNILQQQSALSLLFLPTSNRGLFFVFFVVFLMKWIPDYKYLFIHSFYQLRQLHYQPALLLTIMPCWLCWYPITLLR